MNKGFVQSSRHFKDWLSRPGKFTMFHELYYGQTNVLPADKTDKIKYRLEVTMNHFLESDTLKEMAYNEQIEFLEAEKFRILQVGKLKIYVVLDLLYRDYERDKWVIVDWKTGKQSEEDPYQLALYALYLLETYPIPSYKNIIIRNEYLLDGTSTEHQLDPVTLDKVQEIIGTSTEWMNEYLDDVHLNKPLPLDQFPKTDDKRTCQRCNFYELCFS